ncbi:UNKNOWN [Stylonychia lemnae]|uniref:TLDc domain-containing protein n=1 Tax=Stylonychia lemnae TaxID=5949 RepID=A0A078B4Z8_STYLE|nr:UNKNOWN [Stylonychia lemnae]|eukprot:CDW88613.1 UNKNOWN [Stylonychia lemnae]
MFTCPGCQKYYNLSLRKPLKLPCKEQICLQCYNLQTEQVQNMQIQCPSCMNLSDKNQPINEYRLLIIYFFLIVALILLIYLFGIIQFAAQILIAVVAIYISIQFSFTYVWRKIGKRQKDNSRGINASNNLLLSYVKSIQSDLYIQNNEKYFHLDIQNQSAQEMEHQQILIKKLKSSATNIELLKQEKRQVIGQSKIYQINIVPIKKEPLSLLEVQTREKMNQFSLAKYKAFRRLVNDQLLKIDKDKVHNPKLLPLSVKTKLLYKATRDGYKAYDFHRLCDNQGPTISFILSELGFVFGGYTSLDWKSTQVIQGKKDTHAFLFSLTHQTLHLQRPPIQDHAVMYDQDYLMRFSGDIAIANDCNFINESQCQLGLSYKTQEGHQFGDEQAFNYLAGSQKFRIIEIEVYSAI